MPQVQPRFLDSFDSVRTQQAPILTDAQLKLHLLLGETVRISQTQAFDSAALLRYGGEAEFLDLIRKGAIEIVMQSHFASPWEAFASKVKDETFHLSAWPEFEEVGRPKAEGQPSKGQHIFTRAEASTLIEEASRRKKVPWDLPPELERRWRSLLEISRACEEARTWRRPTEARTVTHQLGDRIHAASLHHTSQQHLVPHLKTLAACGAASPLQRNDRSLYHRHVQAIHHSVDAGIRRSLHSIIDMLYNQVISESLSADAELTTHADDAREVVKGYDSKASILIGDGEADDLEALTWPLLLHLREILHDEELSIEKKKALFRERCVLSPFKLEDEQGWAFRFVPKFADAGADLALGKVVTFIVNGLMPGALTTAGSIMMSLATSVSASLFLRVGEQVEEQIDRHRLHARERSIVARLDKGLEQVESLHRRPASP